jgi:class 3 adenylate cyclase/tetratricopeptide (TPR) repeat protein
MRRCLSCGYGNADDARFCSQCATPLEPGMQAREERKVVTCLFCDLVGFTARAEEMDPEDVAKLLAPYQARLREELERHGGSVEKFIGDAVMALFGAPVAHEDDPERAVRAALAIRDFADDEGIELRIGITTGEALVSLDARPEQGETVATGDVVNTAARLQSAAPVNGILVGETTYRATQQAIEFAEHEPVEAKGKTRPVPVWEARTARARVALDRLHGTALVGRGQELALLEGALTRVRQELSPQLVTIVGVPGIGKSRLVFELSQIVDRDPEIIFWRQGRCLSYGEGVTFWALGEIVKAQAGILETDAPAAAEEKLAVVAPDEWVRSHLRPLVGLGAEQDVTAGQRGEAFAAWRTFLEALAEERPLVLVIEDLHWADETLLDFIDHVVDWATGVPLLVVCSARPELLERRPGWGGGKPNALTLSLSPLSDDETARLISDLLERSVLPSEAQQALLARAGGNPLYAEQFARMLVEGGALEDDARLPETVQGLIAARLDLLPPDEKTLLQDAAVLGKTFWSGALASLAGGDGAVLDERLHSLERKQFVRRERRSTVEGEDEHSFRHILVRDVAYSQIPRADRAEKHRLTAEWIESLGRPEDQSEMLAHHYLQALELTRAAGGNVGELADRARHALRDAGDRALALNALSAAAAFYEAALELWLNDDPERPQLLFRHGTSLRNVERGQRVLETAYEALLGAGDAESAAETQLMLAPMLWHAGNRDGCFERLELAAELLREAPPSRAKAYLLSQVSRFRMLAGEDDAAIRAGEEALAIAEELDLDEVKASVLDTIGVSRVNEGDMSGIQDIERSIEIALAANSAECVRGYTNLSATLLASVGDLERGIEADAEGIRAAERFGDEIGLRFLRGHQMLSALITGRWDESLAIADEFIAAGEAGSPHYMECAARHHRAAILLARDHSEEALAQARASIELARRIRDPQVLQPALVICANVVYQAGETREAEAFVVEFLDSWPRTLVIMEYLHHSISCVFELGHGDRLSSLLRGAVASPWRDAAEAALAGDPVRDAEILAGIGARTYEAAARLRAAKQLVEQGRRAEADDQLLRALAFYRSVGATRYVRQAEALLGDASEISA